MTTRSAHPELYREMEETLGRIPAWVELMPDGAVQGFWAQMRDFELAETRIPNKYKELIGLAVAGATRCRYCALFHTEAARLFGATDEEIAEACMMGGHTMGASTFLNAAQVDYDQFKAEMLEIVDYVRRKLESKTASGGKPAESQQAAHA